MLRDNWPQPVADRWLPRRSARSVNWLIASRIPPAASPSGFGAVASYRYDALGRRIAKTVQGRTILYLPAGAQTVVEVERAALPQSQAQIDGIEADGTLANLTKVPASGGILPGSVTRVNFQPSTAAIPAGFLGDKGKPFATRTNGLSYGWASDAAAQAVERHGAVPLPEFDTFVQALSDSGATNAWSIALPNGSYPVIVVAGDALSTEQTNNLSIGGQVVVDTTPSTAPSYEQGNFDGYAVQVTVINGILTVAPSAGALRAKLCFIEIGQEGGTISQETRDRLAALIAKANAQTGASPEPQLTQKEFFYGSYVDEVVAYTVSYGATASRYYVSSNHLYSPAAITDSSGVVVERMKYDAYGRQTILPPGGTPPRTRSSVGFDRGFTGYIKDEETGLLHARARQYSPTLGRFVGRDTWTRHQFLPKEYDGYQDGFDLYAAQFVPNRIDPSGKTPVVVVVGMVLSVAGIIIGWEAFGCDPNGPGGDLVTQIEDCRVPYKCPCNANRDYFVDRYCFGQRKFSQPVRCVRSAWFGWLRGTWQPAGNGSWSACDATDCCEIKPGIRQPEGQ